MADGFTPMFIACQNGQLSVCKWLLEVGAAADITKAANDGATPMYVACEKGHLSVCKWLFEVGAAADSSSSSSDESLASAALAASALLLLPVLTVVVSSRVEARDRGFDMAGWLAGRLAGGYVLVLLLCWKSTASSVSMRVVGVERSRLQPTADSNARRVLRGAEKQQPSSDGRECESGRYTISEKTNK